MASFIDVKFRDGLRVRVLENRPIDLDGVALKSGGAAALLDRLAGSTWRRLHTSSEDVLEKLRISGKHPNGKALPDLSLWLRLELKPELDADETLRALMQLDEVEAAERVTAVNPQTAITAPDFSIPDPENPRPFQGYLHAAPAGIDVMEVWGKWGIDGTGIRICDVEFGWLREHAHKDLGDVTVVGADPVLPDGWSDNHGTAVMGVYGGRHDHHGVRGVAYGATKLFSACRTMVDGAGHTNVPDAITRAAQALARGDILLIEVGEFGPRSNPTGADPVFGTLPATWSRANYDAVVTAVANGIIVIETAGNGTQDLDDAIYSAGHRPFLSSGDPLAQDDSGSIMVGACEGNGNLAAWANTNHGNRVNLFSWGFFIVTTLGSNRPVSDQIQVVYDPFEDPADPDFQNPHAGFAGNFGGTSGASAIVAGAAALMQHYFRRYHARTLPSDEMRALLWRTGTPAVPGKLIGRQPNVRAAIESLVTFYQDQIPAPVITPAAASSIENVAGTPPIEVRIDFAPGDTGGGEIHYGFTPDVGSGSEPFDVADPNARIRIHATSTLYACVFRRAGAEGYWTRGQVATGTYFVATTRGTGCRTAAAVLFAMAASVVAAAVYAMAWIL